MKFLESQFVSLCLHGALVAYLIYSFVPPQAVQEGQGLLMEMIQTQASKGTSAPSAKVKRAKKELLSKPVATATQPSRPKPIPQKSKDKPSQISKKNGDPRLTQEKSSWKKEIKEGKKKSQAFAKKQTPTPSKTSQTGQKGSVNQGPKPSPSPQSPFVGDAKTISSEKPGDPNAIREAKQLKIKPGNIQPVYPALDRLNNREGTVVIVARVNEQGFVEDMTLESNSGSPLMKVAAFDAFSKYQFFPGQSGRVRKSFTFQLKGPAKEFHAQVKDENSSDDSSSEDNRDVF